MLADKPRQPILLKPYKNFPVCKSLSKIIIPLTVKNLPEYNRSVHHSQKQLELVTSSNFVIKKHKPIANPWKEYCVMNPVKSNKLVVKRMKVNSLSPFKILADKSFCVSRPRTKVRKSHASVPPPPLPQRVNSLSGWV
jgi:hypothetical protein